ncbi:PAS domain-containing sensor histidine kinase [Dyadobacter fanqingshengii]|uniref:histidine kinase n=1 Tax=Dyadobacter fanqingshengii TaxID=2906443 RepID=A0A9X1TG47_9BACT|nr:PAS domain-containing protein [Dyadobacter fanqingshengii]MCF0040177.1 PAS domain-containing protein [Dyadobacter fanqingshengii]USJ38072.1 PAS domain-containing protein [Dyadobacter fanqingshengii]
MGNLHQETGSTERVVDTKSYAQTSVNDSETKFRNTMRQAPVGITILRGPEFFVEMANDTYLSIVDKREDEFVNKPLFESLPEARNSIEEILNRVLKTAIPYNGNEFEIIIKRFGKPEQCYFNFVYQPLIEDSGEISGIIVVATEVTQQVLAKQRLERSENQFRTLVTQSQFAKAILKGPEFVISIANESMLKNLWGRELYEVLGQRLFDVFPELETQNLGKILRDAYQSGKLYRDNEAAIVINGNDGLKEHYVDFQYAPIFETDDEVSGIMISLNDVTDKVTFRKQILEAAERLSLATDGTQLATWDLDLNTKHIIYSGRLAAIFGFEETKVLTHQQMRDFLHPDDRKAVVEKAFEMALQTGNYYYEARIIHPDNSIHWIRTQGKILYDDHHRPHRMLGTMMDITDRKEDELALKISEDKYRTLADELESQVQLRTKELTVANSELVKTNMELAQFAYVASHDLQEPLRKIQTFATRILETENDNLTERGKDYFRRMQASSTRMQQLIVDLLAFSRANAVEKHFEKIDLNVVLQNVTEQLGDMILQTDARIVSDDLPVWNIIEYQFEQLFTNLIANAIKFTKPGTSPVITIRSGVIPGELIPQQDAEAYLTYQYLSFSDNGIGFDPQFKDRIFQVFQRLHNRSAYEGTGIGLAICKKIVENHKGLIDAIGKPGIGSTFIVYLPCE